MKSSKALDRHTAGPQLAGYLYQIQCSLLRLFELQEGECLGIEIFDDHHVEKNDEIVELGQYKYHTPRKSVRLNDSSPELWKTLGIWASAVTDRSLNLSNVQRLILITRAAPSPGSAVEMISNNSLETNAIIDKFLGVPRPAEQKLAKSYDAVHALSRNDLNTLFRRITIQGMQPNLVETLELLRVKIRQIGFYERSVDEAAKSFCGWLWEKVLVGLEDEEGVLITEEEFHNAKCLIRDQFAGDRLSTRHADVEFEDVKDEIDLSQQSNKIYLQQLDLIGITQNAKLNCILDYLRATRERSDWISTGEILPKRLELFDRELVDRWKTEFDIMCEDVIEGCGANILCKVGREHFRSIQRLNIPIQDGWFHSYLTKGSYHALADRLRVGWHPNFKSLI